MDTHGLQCKLLKGGYVSGIGQYRGGGVINGDTRSLDYIAHMGFSVRGAVPGMVSVYW